MGKKIVVAGIAMVPRYTKMTMRSGVEVIPAIWMSVCRICLMLAVPARCSGFAEVMAEKIRKRGKTGCDYGRCDFG